MSRGEELRAKVINAVPCKAGEIHTFETEKCRMAVLIEGDEVFVVIREGAPRVKHTNQAFTDFMEWQGAPRQHL